jgi:hypothetical protein
MIQSKYCHHHHHHHIIIIECVLWGWTQLICGMYLIFYLEGAGIDVPGASLQMQTQAGQRDSTVTGTVDARHPLSLIDWFVYI